MCKNRHVFLVVVCLGNVFGQAPAEQPTAVAEEPAADAEASATPALCEASVPASAEAPEAAEQDQPKAGGLHDLMPG